LKLRYDHVGRIAEPERRCDADKHCQNGSDTERPTDSLMPGRRWPGRVDFLGCDKAGAGWHKGSFRAECHDDLVQKAETHRLGRTFAPECGLSNAYGMKC
jgi:hypothetical protein